MRSHSIILLILTTLFTWNCSRNNDLYATEIKYYFEVICASPKADCQQLKEYLEENLPQYKYTITNQSGKKWPYYQAFKLDVEVPIDSLMPPHWQLHRFIRKTNSNELNEGEFLVRFELFPKPDTTTNYNVIIYKMEDSNLSLSATTGIKVEDVLHKDSSLTFSDAFLKTIIRDSFK